MIELQMGLSFAELDPLQQTKVRESEEGKMWLNIRFQSGEV